MSAQPRFEPVTIDQRVYDLYDEYCHGRIDRREFLARAGALVIGGVSALAMAQSLFPRYVEAQTIMFTDPRIKVTATCVRVPVFVGHSEAVNLEFERPLDEAEARAILAKAPGVTILDRREDGGYITPVEIAGDDPVYVSRIRSDPTIENGLNLWIVSDNLRKGAALNAIQIAEEMIRGQHLKAAA